MRLSSDEVKNKQRWCHGWVLLMAALLLLATFITPVAVAADAEPEWTTVYLVRHAEKQKGDDPALNATGEQRAKALAHVLWDVDVDAVFATEYRRTQLTAAPLAAAKGLAIQSYAAGDVAGLAHKLLADYAGRTVLVVGHSNTVGRIAEQLGAPGVGDLREAQYDRLIVVHRLGDAVHLQRLRFGLKTR